MKRKDAIEMLAKRIAAWNGMEMNPDYSVYMDDATDAVGIIEKAMKDFKWHPELETVK